MKAMEPRLTRAVVEWTGWGRSPRPDRDDARVIARFGSEAGPALAKAARRLEADYSSGSAEFRADPGGERLFAGPKGPADQIGHRGGD